MTAQPAFRPSETFPFVSLLRAIGALLVVWCHLGINWPAKARVTWFGADFTAAYVTTPFVIMGNLGQLGVCLFFLVSGFIITHVGLREDPLTFAVKRLFRIYPPLWASLALILAINACYPRFTGLPRPLGHPTWSDIAYAGTLAGFLTRPKVILSEVSWTLIVEVTFYTMTCAFLPAIKRAPRAAVLLQLAGCFVLFRSFQPDNRLINCFIDAVGWIPCLLVGQITYLGYRARLGLWSAAGLTGLAFLLFSDTLRGVFAHVYAPPNALGVSFLYAYLAFLFVLAVNHALCLPRAVQFYSDTSYSLYLTHAFVGFFVLDILRDLRFEIALAGAFAAASAAGYLGWVFVERPSQALGRKLLGRLHRRSANLTPIPSKPSALRNAA